MDSPLRLALLSAPRTGNVWLKSILADLYDIPVRDEHWAAYLHSQSGADVPLPEGGWVLHQHINPTGKLLDFLRRNDISVITTVRHPGDVLVSMYHFARARMAINDATLPREYRLMSRDEQVPGLHTFDFSCRTLPLELIRCMLWANHNATVVSYERLCADPSAEVQKLANAIRSVSEADIRAAVARNTIDKLRERNADNGHIRTGGSGAWKTQLFREAAQYLRTEPIVDAYCRMFNYDWDVDPGAMTTLLPVDSEIAAHTAFDDGTDFPMLLKVLYEYRIPDARTRWPHPWRIQSGFAEWLNAPAAQDKTSARVPFVTVSNLMTIVWQMRTDIAAAFPEPFSDNRFEFCVWFRTNAPIEYNLPGRFLPAISSDALCRMVG